MIVNIYTHTLVEGYGLIRKSIPPDLAYLPH